MYKIDKAGNLISPLNVQSFSSLGFKEREHLQEWIAKEPSVLGEDLLIIQKEFSGFDDTNERLDLLALDKQGALVVIENKLDDSGKDVTWQALKYASYCSSLTKANILSIYQEYLDKYQSAGSAEENLLEFFDGEEELDNIELNKGVKQRVILIAAKFRREVTSTVLWLMNYKIQLQCFKVTPYSLDENLFLNVEQIIPTKDAEEYMIGMADKVQNDLNDQTKQNYMHSLRQEFWSKVIDAMNETESLLYRNISRSKYHWLGAASGVRGLGLNFVVTTKWGRVELYIDRGGQEKNKKIFDSLFEQKDQIEQNFGAGLIWERLDKKRASRIKVEIQGDIRDKLDWGGMVEFMVSSMIKLEKSLSKPLSKLADEKFV